MLITHEINGAIPFAPTIKITMKQEEKELLIKDLCARLPYGVKLHCVSNVMICIGPYTLNTIVLDRFCNENTEYVPFDDVKPYLYPLSSITEKQKKECPVELSIINAFIDGSICLSENEELTTDEIIKLFDWLNKNHFDYRGLIQKGLAIDATGLGIY